MSASIVPRVVLDRARRPPAPRGRPPLAAGLVLAALAACVTTPTGRRALHLMPEDQLAELGAQAFRELKLGKPATSDSGTTSFVRCVSRALIRQLPAELASPDAWEIVVFEDETPNAFALPGGKIGVHTGILRAAKNEAQLAAVIGHELGHVTAHHGNERVSQSLAAEGGLQLIALFSGAADPQASETKRLVIGLLGAGVQVGVLLPFSRTQESEADRIGLELMARAGFDPEESVALWRNLEALGGNAAPELLSTHPSPGSRIEGLEQQMAPAREAFSAARSEGRRPGCEPSRG